MSGRIQRHREPPARGPYLQQRDSARKPCTLLSPPMRYTKLLSTAIPWLDITAMWESLSNAVEMGLPLPICSRHYPSC